ncbi:hypothetical protein LS74_005310 [Helicobacter magdeburgensis]|uniref:Uncharacterized protein n=1 Tax=Helicobacter magdeburgensis TaxID=471858 RepID=A0A4U8SZE7_9HELI|nr:hypothetical protein [Helicobacter magdeburgensis]TLD92459.1 hypothetical protein LS74_005310 [Helicobacter magdeburgensis]
MPFKLLESSLKSTRLDSIFSFSSTLKSYFHATQAFFLIKTSNFFQKLMYNATLQTRISPFKDFYE